MGKFRIKIASTWFSRDFIVLKYSTNGIFWKTVKECEYDYSSEWNYMVPMVARVRVAEELLNRFKTLEDVKQFEEKQRQLVAHNNAQIWERNERRRKEREDIYKRFS